MEQKVIIKSIDQLTHDVKRFVCEKPRGYTFTAGQATEVAINKKGWEKEKRPFSFTSLTESSNLEFTIKLYKDHNGVTRELDTLEPGDELIIDEAWGAIAYQGPGYFIAGGAGITPFIAILRQLHQEQKLAGNKLFFSNKTERDIILQPELTAMLGSNVIYTITGEPTNNYQQGYIEEQFLKTYVKDFSQHFYLCGPPQMVTDMQEILVRLGASPETVVFEK
ncbi:MAG: FAD-binding oxidoreductase [Bacteroidota bacterium]|nr:FAD-binding oxidoreductase [Bacteroidota bacterium]